MNQIPTGFLHLPLELVLMIPKYLSGQELVAFSQTCSSTREALLAPESRHLWVRVLNSEMTGAAMDGVMPYWYEVTRRMAFRDSSTNQLATWLRVNYRINQSINYSEIMLEDAMRVDFPWVTERASVRALMRAVPYFKAEGRMSGHHWDATPRHFRTDDGTRQLICKYRGLERIGQLPAPFPLGETPLFIFNVMLSSLNRKSGTGHCHNYYLSTLPRWLEQLLALIRAVCDSTEAEQNQVGGGNNGGAAPSPVIKHFLLPRIGELGAGVDLGNVTLASLRRSDLLQGHRYIEGGGQDLVADIAQVGADVSRPTALLLFAHASMDPYEISQWLPRLANWSGNSLFGYAFTADKAFRRRHDVSLYGRGHLDYLICVTLAGLRLYENYRVHNGVPEGEPIPFEELHEHAGLSASDALALSEMLVRRVPDRFKGAKVYMGAEARAPGESLPRLYLL